MTDSLSQVVTNFLDGDAIDDKYQAATLFYQACLQSGPEGLDSLKRLLAAGYGPTSWPETIRCGGLNKTASGFNLDEPSIRYTREHYFETCFRVAVLQAPINLTVIKLLLDQEFLPSFMVKTHLLVRCDHDCPAEELYHGHRCGHGHLSNLALVKLLLRYDFDDRFSHILEAAVQSHDLKLVETLVIWNELLVDEQPDIMKSYGGISFIRECETKVYPNLVTTPSSTKTADPDLAKALAIKALLRQFKLYRDRSDSYLIYLAQLWSPEINMDLNHYVYRLKNQLDRDLAIVVPFIGSILVGFSAGVILGLAFDATVTACFGPETKLRLMDGFVRW